MTKTKFRGENMVQKEISLWSNLPSDMLSLIKSRLFAGDISTFNMICKSWQSIMLASRILPPPIDSSLAHTPCLVTLRNNVCEFYNPVYDANYEINTPQLSGARIRSSGYGWLLLSKDDDTLFFFNPFTKETIYLPKYSRWLNIMLMITFSSPPTSPDCFVIGIAELGIYKAARVITIRRGDAFWKLHDFLDNGYGRRIVREKKNLGGDCVKCYQKKFLEGSYCSPVFLNDKCYFLGEMGNIGVFDVNENTWKVCGEAWPPGLTRPVSMVMEKDGILLCEFLSREHRQVCMRRFNLSKIEWETVKTLGNDKMLYVSDGTSFLETSVATGMGNKIYFPLFDRNMIGVFYSMSTKKYHSSDGKYCSKYPFNLTEPRSSTWIKPVYTPSADVEELKW